MKRFERSSTLDWYFQELGKRKVLTKKEEIQKFKELDGHRNRLYAAINDHAHRFIDNNFQEFRADEEEAEFNRWHFIHDISQAYLGKVDSILQKYPSSRSDTYKKLQAKKEEVIKLYETWNRSKNELIEANLRLVVSRAKIYKKMYPLEERIAEGNLGLARAIETFEVEKGYKFSTYANWWIRQAIVRGCEDKFSTIRLPVYIQESIKKIEKAEARCVMLLGKKHISDTEIAAYLRKTAKQKARTEKKKFDPKKVLKAEEVSKFRNIGYETNVPSSLDIKVSDDHDADIYSIVPDKNSPDPEQQTTSTELSTKMEEVISNLGPREQDILRRRFGIGYDRRYTLDEIGLSYELTRERIRQIETKVLRKLQHPNRIKELEGFR